MTTSLLSIVMLFPPIVYSPVLPLRLLGTLIQIQLCRLYTYIELPHETAKPLCDIDFGFFTNMTVFFASTNILFFVLGTSVVLVLEKRPTTVIRALINL